MRAKTPIDGDRTRFRAFIARAAALGCLLPTGCGDDASPKPPPVVAPDTSTGDAGTSDAAGDADESPDDVHDVHWTFDTDDPDTTPYPWDAGCEPIPPTPLDDCLRLYKLPCGLPPDLPEGVALEAGACIGICPDTDAGSAYQCATYRPDGGMLNLACTYCSLGRRPRGFRGAATSRPKGVGDLLAIFAELEAASVAAFRHLGRDLRRHGAPRALLRMVARARKDEARHARAMGRLSRSAGRPPRRAHVAHRSPPSLIDVATTNLVEGCLRESFGAAVALVQARTADDPRVRRVMARVAADELRHAELSFRVARWSRARLSAGAGRALDHALDLAVRALRREVREGQPTPEVRRRLGLPTREAAERMVDAIAGQLLVA